MDPLLSDLVKTGGSAFLGWVVGRKAENAARIRSQQEKLVEAVRTVGKLGVEYHCLTLDPNGLVVRAEHLKLDLWRIRCDLQMLATHCALPQTAWVKQLLALQDAVTEFPFEPAELPADRDQARSKPIGVAMEELVRCIQSWRPPVLGKWFNWRAR